MPVVDSVVLSKRMSVPPPIDLGRGHLAGKRPDTIRSLGLPRRSDRGFGPPVKLDLTGHERRRDDPPGHLLELARRLDEQHFVSGDHTRAPSLRCDGQWGRPGCVDQVNNHRAGTEPIAGERELLAGTADRSGIHDQVEIHSGEAGQIDQR